MYYLVESNNSVIDGWDQKQYAKFDLRKDNKIKIKCCNKMYGQGE